MQEVKEIAKKWGIPFKIGMTKEYLIRAIQSREGNTPCFRTKSGCSETGCLWMGDCIPTE
jgi:hypothetical protein